MNTPATTRANAVIPSLTTARLLEDEGALPPGDTRHARTYHALNGARQALLHGERAAALTRLAQVEDWDWTDALFQTVTDGSCDIEPGELRLRLAGLALDTTAIRTDAVHQAALAVLQDYYTIR